MIRSQVEGLLKSSAANAGTDTFDISVPPSEVSSVLTILSHLCASGQFSDFSRRDAEGECTRCQDMSCGCIRIYGYTG